MYDRFEDFINASLFSNDEENHQREDRMSRLQSAEGQDEDGRAGADRGSRKTRQDSRTVRFPEVFRVLSTQIYCFCFNNFRESDITKERIQKILATGANVILTTGGIDDLCLKYFVEAGAMAVRRCKKADLKRIAKATGGQLVVTLANLEGEETFEASSLGAADEVVTERISDDELILIKGCVDGSCL